MLICGSYYKSLCRHQFTDYSDARTPLFTYKQNTNVENDYVFCKPEFLQMLKGTKFCDENEFTLVTHNSDINFDKTNIEAVLEFLPNIKHWYTQNLLYEHPKVSPIPIGIANPKWSHGNQNRFKKIIKENNKKDNLFYANFNISTNPEERRYCYNQIGLECPESYPNAASISDHDNFVINTQENYLRKISKSYFTISPDGNGKDCHKTWESIYLKSIPIVTDSFFARKFRDMDIPILVIDDWREFKNLKLSESLYNHIWKNFDIKTLSDIMS
jgi:hypothetical protein